MCLKEMLREGNPRRLVKFNRRIWAFGWVGGEKGLWEGEALNSTPLCPEERGN